MAAQPVSLPAVLTFSDPLLDSWDHSRAVRSILLTSPLLLSIACAKIHRSYLHALIKEYLTRMELGDYQMSSVVAVIFSHRRQWLTKLWSFSERWSISASPRMRDRIYMHKEGMTMSRLRLIHDQVSGQTGRTSSQDSGRRPSRRRGWRLGQYIVGQATWKQQGEHKFWLLKTFTRMNLIK